MSFQKQSMQVLREKRINKMLQEKYVIRNYNWKHHSDQSLATVNILFDNTRERFGSTEQTEVD